MAVFKTFDSSTNRIGSPFNGAVSGVSVTISGTTVRGSTTVFGTIRKFSGSQTYTPLDQRVSVVGDRTIKYNIGDYPTLPLVLPTTIHLKQQPVKVTTYTTLSTSSFTAPTIGGTVVRMSTAEIAALVNFGYSVGQFDETNYISRGLNSWMELSVFGMINHRLFMDY